MTTEERLLNVSEDQAFHWLHTSSLQTLFRLLNRDGEEMRVVGGAVRNALLGAPVADIDCATTAQPSQVVEWAKAADIRSIPTGIDHGTVTLVIDGQGFEITTLRTDVETDGRRAQVQFGRSWSDDAHRRDFTMNAVYLDQAGQLYDPTGCGIEDARNCYVRFIGDASERIEEDYLRVLRFFRFYAHYGKHYNRGDYEACIAAQQHLSSLSRERVGSEMCKLLQGRFGVDSLTAMLEGGMLSGVLACVPHISRYSRLLSLAQKLQIVPDLPILLTALCINTDEDALRVAKVLRLPNRVRNEMSLLVQTVGSVQSLSQDQIQRLIYSHGKNSALGLVLLALVNRHVNADLAALSQVLLKLETWRSPVFPVSGRDLLDRGVKPGPHLGDLLSFIEDAWVASGFQLTKEQLLADKMLKSE